MFGSNNTLTYGLRVAALLLLVIGIASRVAPLADHDGRLLRQFPSEDGYLMLTMGRNLALGKGLSVSDGTMATNGTQPLATFVWAGAFAAADGDKRAGVFNVLALSVLIGAVGAVLVFVLARRLLPDASVALLAAALWFASTITLAHTMNCLETGLYLVFVVLTILAYTRWLRADDHTRGIGSSMAIGALLGVTFWVRNDAVFLTAALCGARLVHRAGRRQAFREAFYAGATALIIAAPWLAFNVMRFGHIVPVSGRTESQDFVFARNLSLLPSKLAEYLLPIVDIPAAVEKSAAGAVAATVVVAAVLVIAALLRRRLSAEARQIVTVYVLFLSGLGGYYGLYFGAPWFVSRFLFPVSPFLIVVGLGVAMFGVSRLPPRPMRLAVPAVLAALVVHQAWSNVERYRNGTKHTHFQVVEWVDNNVEDEQWVGAIQTGTLGFFHDRTINFDGKVNVDALESRLAGYHHQYIVDSPIEFFADWAGFVFWKDSRIFGSRFELIVEDHERNLAVFRRRRS